MAYTVVEETPAPPGAVELSSFVDLPAVDDDYVAPPELVPYLTAPSGISDEAYREWLERVCDQPVHRND